MEEMKNKVVLITGASSGIGEGLACAFARQGASLSLCGRNVENLKKVAEKCVSEGAAKTIQVVADVKNVKDMERMVDETVAKLGQIDVLINNAGYGCKGGIENGTLEQFDEVFSVNLKAPYYLMQLCLPHLKKTKGCVINLSSCYTNMFVPDAVHYSMTKVGLDHLTKCAAIELGKYGIRVNNVNPGLVVTEMVKANWKPDELEAFCKDFLSNTPLENESLSIQEVADVVIFLTSSAAKSITGTCLPVEKGRILMGN
uniref:uncharacterized protein LOC104266214 n=1 Tax=Ciona intestinalis TaxID=7719 RepID=UPI000180CFFE|nr:uncharacterized protein LOC104266214 [Ciona intestinalis]|eukprot:XP_009860181.1 uncharacterized protein LOC104266214 [Ciona intestinalis]